MGHKIKGESDIDMKWEAYSSMVSSIPLLYE